MAGEDINQPLPSDKQLAIPGDQSVVSVRKDLVEQGVDLQVITDCITQKGLLIPAGENRQPVRILPTPAYYRWEHGINLVEVDIMKTRKTPPVFIATYLMGIGEPISEVRSIRLPVQTTGRMRDIEDEMTRQMVVDGLNPNEIRQYTPEAISKPVIGRLAGTTLRNLFRALKYGHFETSGVHPEWIAPGLPDGRLQSGWNENDRLRLPLIIWSNWKAPICAMFGNDGVISDMSKEPVISPPFTQQGIDAADPLVKGILNRVVAKNQRAGR